MVTGLSASAIKPASNQPDGRDLVSTPSAAYGEAALRHHDPPPGAKPNPATPPAAAATIMIAAVCTNAFSCPIADCPPAAGTGAFGAFVHLHFQSAGGKVLRRRDRRRGRVLRKRKTGISVS
jgi:hypothetical protein